MLSLTIARLHKFDSGVLVVQSVTHSKEVIIEETAKLVSIYSPQGCSPGEFVLLGG